MKVRECKLQDLEWLKNKAVAFNDTHFDIPLCSNKLHAYLTALIVNPMGVALRTDTGAIVGVLTEDPLRTWEVLVETAWYSEGKDGIRLLKAFETVGLEAGVDEIRMTTLQKNDIVGQLLKKRGYAPIETSHRLIL